MFSTLDIGSMQRALELARLGLQTTTPNPRVGCVIVRDGEVVGEGWHRAAGEPHAEVHALAAAGERARGATAYVTLEPCAHTGRTGPCADALIRAGIGSVVAATIDPNPEVAGQGLERLRQAGVEVRAGLLSEEALDLNRGFFQRMQQGRAWVRAKLALSLDGRTALPDGSSRWITDGPSRTDGHRWRSRSCAILTGIGTVLADDPMLNVRLVETPRQPRCILMDSRLRLPLEAKLVQHPHLVVVSHLAPEAFEAHPHRAVLQDRGVELMNLPQRDLRAALERLTAAHGLNEIHVEAGPGLTAALVRESLVDEFLIYQAPVFLGEGLPALAGMPTLSAVADAHRWRLQSADRVGEGLRLRLFRGEDQ